MTHSMPGVASPAGTADRSRLIAAAFLRALATGLMGVLLGIFLARRDFSPADIGLVIAAGLSGAVLSALIVTYAGDRLGRRRALLVLALLGAGGGLLLLLVEHVIMACLVAFIGMVNGMGRDRGASLILEQAILPSTTDTGGRTRAFARYNVMQDIGHALGGLLAALPTLLQQLLALSPLLALQTALSLYVLLLLGSAWCYGGLSSVVETVSGDAVAQPPITAQSRRTVWRIAGLFAIDSIAGGFLGTALLSYFFFERFGVSEALIAVLFFAARGANALSHLGAAWLAARIGLVNTMVFTHIPSSLLLIAVAFVPNFWWAALLFLLRELLVEMDVPTRQSYVMAVVQPHERTWASGVTNLVRLGGWAVAPSLAGVLMQGLALSTPLLIGAAMKISYDLLLWRSFRHLHPPEERASGS